MSKRVPIGIMLIALLMIILVLWSLMTVEAPLISNMKFSDSEYNLSIEPFYDETDDVYILYIPSYTNAEEIRISKSDFISIDFYDDNTNYNNDISAIPLNTPVKMQLNNFNNTEEYNLMIMQSENISTIYIETESETMDYVNENKDNKEDASVLIIDSNGMVTFEGMSTISGRGNSTWAASKKPYDLKFDSNVNLCGDDYSNEWFLLANYADESRIRNAVCLHTANDLGIRYTSEVEFISLYLNGEYEGLYNLGMLHKYTNGYDNEISVVFERTSQGDEYSFISDNGTAIRMRYGDSEEAQLVINNFEELLYQHADYELVEQYIDIDSFIYKYMIDEIFADDDIYKSQFYAIDNNGKIIAICAWDYDLSIGITWNKYVDLSFNSMKLSNDGWYNNLFKYDEYQQRLINIYDQNYSYFNTIFKEYLDQCYVIIQTDWYLDQSRWLNSYPFNSGSTILKCDYLNMDTLEGNITYIEQFIEERTDFLYDYWHHMDDYCRVSFSSNSNENIDVRIYCLIGTDLTDDVLPDGLLSIDNSEFLGWYTEDGISVTDYGIITENVTFYAAWESDDASLQEAA